MKQSGSLDQVLGDIQAFNVQPYQVFVEEEQKKLHEHWWENILSNIYFYSIESFMLPSYNSFFLGIGCNYQKFIFQLRMPIGDRFIYRDGK